LLRQKESNQRKGDPGLWLRHNLKVSLRRNKLLRSVLSPLRGALRCWLRHNLKVSLRRNKPLRGVLSSGQAAAELALRAQTVLADTP